MTRNIWNETGDLEKGLCFEMITAWNESMVKARRSMMEDEDKVERHCSVDREIFAAPSSVTSL